jgi:hypothetical protein
MESGEPRARAGVFKRLPENGELCLLRHEAGSLQRSAPGGRSGNELSGVNERNPTTFSTFPFTDILFHSEFCVDSVLTTI